MSNVLQWTVAIEEEGLRLDAFLSHHLSGFSRRERVELVRQDRVRVNGRSSVKGAIVRSQDIVTAALTPALAPNPTLPVSLLHVASEFVILDKPEGMPSVALRHSETRTVANFLLAHFPEMAQIGPRRLEVGLLHRLDTNTSGIMVAARTLSAYVGLQAQFRQRTVTKNYLAIVEGNLGRKGRVALPLTPTGPHGHHMRPDKTGQGQDAITLYAPVEYFSRHTLVRLSIVTGVRHQIRAHLAALGHPIVGDVAYGAGGETAPRLCLHAETLEFSHPTTGKRMRCTSPVPENLVAFLERLRGTNSRA
ncbi:MAG: RluA family pseudouridine synthase [Deltaproteobacteria bacterium]|nr:RluA family pseudouridine synthase [Deltaproteobacteria bacterium]